jgi:hypothetical protein
VIVVDTKSPGRRGREDVEATIARLKELHRSMSHLPPVTDEFIDWAKREGRE